ncbi:invasion associated locus B family protein [Roseobacter sp. EG26]|uniref:invasion associated locus B family protein n=1 Tax=Roseobacter sp. EG26 TaxID=3412477 RepID=UPI003CE56770
MSSLVRMSFQSLLVLMLFPSFSYAQDKPLEEERTFDDWFVTCSSGQTCRMVQTVIQPSTGRLILQVKIIAGETTTALFTFPLGVLLSTGWSYDIDGRRQRILPFEVCNTDGCHAGLKLSMRELDALKRGNHLNLRFHDAAATEVPVQVSLAGFTNAFNALK